VAEAFAGRIGRLFGAEMPVPSAGGVQLAQGVSLGGPFNLTDHTGRAVTERDFAGRWMLVYFGFTYCPDVCPTELGTMAAALDAMGPAGEAVVPVLITVDPERDGPAQLADYVSRFHPSMDGPDRHAGARWRRRARRYPRLLRQGAAVRDDRYLVDHSGFTYLVGPTPRPPLFRPGTSPEAHGRRRVPPSLPTAPPPPVNCGIGVPGPKGGEVPSRPRPWHTSVCRTDRMVDDTEQDGAKGTGPARAQRRATAAGCRQDPHRVPPRLRPGRLRRSRKSCSASSR
jgi:protein SCO1/2